jgi:hypothetical protein
VCRITSQAAFLKADKFKYLVQELIACNLPEFRKPVSIVVQFRVSNGKAPAFEHFRNVEFQS